MATWDGSYQDPDDSNYHYNVYSNQNMNPNPQIWNCYPTNSNDAVEGRSQNQGAYAQRNYMSYCPSQNQMDGYAISNVAPQPYLQLNVHQEPFVPRHYQTNQFPSNYSAPNTGEPSNGIYNSANKYSNSHNRRDNQQEYFSMREKTSSDISNLKKNHSKSVDQEPRERQPRNANAYRSARNYGGSGRFNYDHYDTSSYDSLLNDASVVNAESTPNPSSSYNGNRKYNYAKAHKENEGPSSSFASSQSRDMDQGNKESTPSQDSARPNTSNNERYFYNDKHRNDKKGRFNNKYKDRQYNNKEFNRDFNNRGKDNNKNSGKKYGGRGESDKEFTNWRDKDNISNPKNMYSKKNYHLKYEKDNAATQRERLTEQLSKEVLECLVCCDHIKQVDAVWSCLNCYHVLHLKCIKKWALSSKDESGSWRCPACRNQFEKTPADYYCFCGKLKNPEWNRRDVVHSCGEVCGRKRPDPECVHKCTLLCHPGSCPECTAMVTKHCSCDKMSQIVKCSSATTLLCQDTCELLLNCGKHNCQKKCHVGECPPCEEIVKQNCHCGKNEREMPCEKDTLTVYECGETCDKTLDCGNHKCTKPCHPGSCDVCLLKPEIVTHCCCSQTPIEKPRESCLDPIPTCGKTCSKTLKCGQPSTPHTCQVECHEGKCPECKLTTLVRCRCGNMDKEIPCKELRTKADDARCEKRCTKKRSCGKHKCNQMCCIDIEHICPLICSKTLNCGRHKCEQTCHKTRCQPCWRSSFDELYCECGSSVIYPPVPCGTKRPTCTQPCSRQHPCGHEVLHTCHREERCPPCTVLTQKWCHGKHELRKAVPCYVTEISCGLPCNKPISCGRHKCIANCHSGPCEKPGHVCTQPCTIPREMCGHICNTPCHEGKCPDTPCKEMVKVTCQCGHRSMSKQCAENAKEYHRITIGILASNIADMQLGHSVDLEEVYGQGKKLNQLKTLECNDECKLIERNRRLALGLQIVNPDLSGKLTPRYSDFMKLWAKKDSAFCQMVHEKLTELVQLAKTSKHKSRSYSFECMNKDKRSFVREACEHFGCQSQAYDQEPKRNIVATAIKDKCWLPSYSLLEVVQRENGLRKVPGPVLKNTVTASSSRNANLFSLNLRKNQKVSSIIPPQCKSPEPEIDYFNFI